MAHIPITVELCLKSGNEILRYRLISQLIQMDKAPMDSREKPYLNELFLQIIRESLQLLNGTGDHETLLKSQCLNQKILVKEAANEVLVQLMTVTQDMITEYHLELGNIRVLMAVPHGPNKQLAEKQYFIDLFQKKLELTDKQAVKDVYVYCTQLLPSYFSDPDLDTKLISELLGTSEINKMIGDVFLGDSKGMFQDVLHEEARMHIQAKKCPYSI